MTAKFVPRELLDPIVTYFHPRRAILFGSQTQGTAGPDSDIDLLELDDDFPPDGLSAKAIDAARSGYSEPLDIIPYRESVLASRSPRYRLICLYRHAGWCDGL
jgi:predicted nucleotidyltransferase